MSEWLRGGVRSLALAGWLLVACGAARAELIFSERFSGTAEDLDGAAPETRPGAETWVATPIFNRDGSLDPAAGSATLAFAPADGNVYQLDTSLREVTGDQNWIALGFGAGQSTLVGTGNRFINNQLIGKAWMLFRGNTNGHQAHLGSATSGTVDPATWAALGTETGDIDMRIELDTTGGAGNWAATWFAKKPSDTDYTEVRGRQVLVDETIDSVGLALARGLVDGRIESFSLSTCPPSSAPFAITAIQYSPDDDMVTLTWPSSEGEQFAVRYSVDMTGWVADLDDSIAADPGDETSRAFDVSGLKGDGRLFFRVEKN